LKDRILCVLVALLVVGILGFLATPKLLTARVGWNDEAAIASLRFIVDAQHEFAAAHGRFATFEVLSGAEGIAPGQEPLSPALLSGAFRHPADGLVRRSGYYFRIDLLAESFRVFAWPVKYDDSGEYSFVIGPDRVVRMTNNSAYTGRNGPTGLHDDEWTSDLRGRH
jgi:type II secretory pathway pseudopilin PulG